MQKTTKKGHGMTGALLITCAVVLVMGLLGGGLLLGYFGGNTDGVATGMVLVIALVYLAVAAGVVAALAQRWREVKGGEEDEARKY